MCKSAWERRRFPNCPVVWVTRLGLVWACLGGARQRKPVGRCVGQWCQGMGGWQGQHHVMEERVAPQLWQGSVAQRVGVVSFRLAWLVGVLHRGHIRG